MIAVAFASGCASQSTEPVRQEVVAASPLPPTQVFFYPAAGQSTAQQDRDRYECHLWAVRQTGFDPSLPMPSPAPRVEVIPSPPPGHDTAVGAVVGALLGAAIARPGDAASGAAVGAVAGAALGAVSDASRQERAEIIQRRYDVRDTQRLAQLERKARDYRRAISACLEGRGYTVY